MPLYGRSRRRAGPFYANLSWTPQPGDPWWRIFIPRITSIGAKAGPVTRNITTGQTSVNLPGPYSYRSRRRHR